MSSSGRRARVSKGQTKYGCFTCKARRVKCDEIKPTCLKCSQYGVTCAGYPAGAPSTSARRESRRSRSSDNESEGSYNTQSLPGSAIPGDLNPLASWTSDVGKVEEKCIEYAISILAPDNVDEYNFVRTLINDYIYQNSPICASAKATAVVLGLAVQNVNDNLSTDIEQKLQPAPYYEKAIGTFRDELCSKSQADADIMISCILLLCAELVLQRWQKALLHLQTLQTSFYAAVISGTCRQDTTSPDLLFRMFDTQKVLFSAFRRAPTVNPFPLQNPADIPDVLTNINILDSYIVKSVHSIICFTSRMIFAACQDRLSDDLEREYYQQINAAQRCVESIDIWLNSEDAPINKAHIMRLHNTCVSALLELSCLFATTESIWDIHIDKFERAISQTEFILDARRRNVIKAGHVDKQQFSLSLGIIQPMYFAALKCRHPLLRRRAIKCLQKSGREGPWNGKVLAVVAERCMLIEEVNCTSPLISNPPHITPTTAQLLSEIVPEEYRISDCQLDVSKGEFQGDDDPRNTTMVAPIRQLNFLRRRQADTFVKVRMACSATVRNSKEHYGFRDMKINSEKWERWSEKGPSY